MPSIRRLLPTLLGLSFVLFAAVPALAAPVPAPTTSAAPIPATATSAACKLPVRVHQGAGALRPLQPNATQSEVTQLTARLLTRYSYEALPLDASMARRVFKGYIDALDPDKMYFTAQDLANFKPIEDHLDGAIWGGDLSGPFAIFNVFEKSVTAHVAYAEALIKKGGFDFNINASYEVDREHAPWAADNAALDTIWRERVMNDWLRLKLAGKSDADIRTVLDKRYQNYLDSLRELDSEDVFSMFLNAYAMANDPHTNYFGPRASENFDISMNLSLDGIGAELERRGDYTTIRQVLPGGPASRSPLQVGDRIVGVGQGTICPMVDVVGWRLDDVVALIRGKKDTTVRLEIIPGDAGPDARHEILSIVRKKVTLKEQAAKKSIITVHDRGHAYRIGVISLPAFYEDFAARRRGDPNYRSATRDVAKLLVELKKDKVDGVIMDLRNNGGGSLTEAIELSGLFIGKGPIVQVRDSNGQIAEQDSDETRVWNGPLAVLVNRASASASEIFAAAMQDYGRALIIGENTYGKGTVQNLVNLDRMADQPKGKLGDLHMTIAEFFRVDGGSTQLKGVTPNIVFPQTINPKDFGESSNPNPLPWSQIKPADYKPVADLQPLIPTLLEEHDARVAKSPAWQLMLDELAAVHKLQAETSISLNYAVRERERKAQDALQDQFRAREKAIEAAAKGPAHATTASAPAHAASAAIAEPAHAASTRDDGLQPNERPLHVDLARERKRDIPDTMLIEAAHILGDEIYLLQRDPHLVATALPPGGHVPPLLAEVPPLR
ncbi:carboxy terminal-processing peptidase [Metallibacterium sp.]|uniref:carboxy terminal-processing peptidase n=1 Tax=Metallibacterium sp. TaxID=2940281 RepID=UPI0026232F59|nr:carboxy terminal-processing peptidase [Metallibacterium sp.]